jgi:hypothetical protein
MTDAPETIRYEGRTRRVIGTLNYPEPPTVGTLLGPNGWGETVVVLGQRTDGRTMIGLAITDDITRATARIVEHGPASPHERKAVSMQRGWKP